MKIVICGSGLLGITTAYVLALRGHEVEVLDRGQVSASETSYANGGQLSYSHAEPWANPAVLPKLPSWILKEDSPLIFRPRLDPEMFRWGLAFLRNCTTSRAKINCVNMLRLGLYSRRKLEVIRRETGVVFDFLDKGILHIFNTEKDLAHAVKQTEFQAKYGCVETVLTRQQVMETEPALQHTSREIVGGIYAPQDESGDPHTFCNALAAYCSEKLGVNIRYGVEIESLDKHNGRIDSVTTNQGKVKGDAYVVALGSYSPLLLKQVGVKIPIYPMKGYSITVPANEYSPTISLTDGSAKIVYSRLGNRVRVAGTAEFTGHDTQILESRIQPIVRATKTLFPNMDWDSKIDKWACLRPSTPDGPPYLGPTPCNNLFLNTGHGTLGWTQAAGSAYIVADIIENKSPEIMLSGLMMGRRFV